MVARRCSRGVARDPARRPLTEPQARLRARRQERLRQRSVRSVMAICLWLLVLVQTRDHMREGQASSSTSEPRTPLHDADTIRLSLLPCLVVRST